jgi:hypothetical protein
MEISPRFAIRTFSNTGGAVLRFAAEGRSAEV